MRRIPDAFDGPRVLGRALYPLSEVGSKGCCPRLSPRYLHYLNFAAAAAKAAVASAVVG